MKYYINKEGQTDKSVWKEAFKYATSLITENTERIVFYFSKKEKIEVWFDKKTDKKLIDELWSGSKKINNIVICAETEITYKKSACYNDIVISMGCMSSVLNNLNQYNNIENIIAIPWLHSYMEDWKRNNNDIQIIE